MSEILEQQYEYIRRTRELLLSFLEEIPVQKLHETVPGFGHGCILRTHIHVIDCYRRWLGSFAFHERWADFRDTADDDIKHYDVKKVRDRFKEVDDIVQKFFHEFHDRWLESIENEVGWMDQALSVTPLFLLTHTETHEFHHKGQIVSMARHLGYTPPITDLD
ncbi:DinB family protein [Alicyclobacillus fastidiosus]|uniref:DinB family protein n=1 Tax=Alicyclobacillus fastidiosus TaxID=392011 RepID=A0ABV5AAK3_9BACL|nr:DinB family protein [Alicyclobacillus fastidiosus]WEH11928.1 DinB family protein [Alicyclobacillus fastidiosus]